MCAMAKSLSQTTLAEPALEFLDRDLSILSFNERVLDWAHRPEVPVLERLRYLCIVSSNLDEFFEVRAEPHVMGSLQEIQSGQYTDNSLVAIADKTNAMVARQYALYNDDLLPTLQRHGYRLLSHGERNSEQRRWVRSYFQQGLHLALGAQLFPARGAAPAGARGSGPGSPFSAGGQQIPQLHCSVVGQGRFWPLQ
jgi:polyphosphate kinase